MEPEQHAALVQKAADLLRQAKFAIVLTGAGSSTPSGIPDFRSSGSGLWTRYLPTEVATLSAFNRHPERFFEWLRPLASHMLSAQPNPAHRSLAALEKQHFIKAVITQNIDGLHHRAGSQNVLPVHGTLETLTCIRCYRQVGAEKYIHSYIEQGISPRCEICGEYLKPDIVLFEEQLPAKIWLQARQATDSCDLMLIAGTSLLVSPVAQLPERAWRHGASIIIVNKTSTYMDEYADIVLRGDVAEIIPAIASEVLDD